MDSIELSAGIKVGVGVRDSTIRAVTRKSERVRTLRESFDEDGKIPLDRCDYDFSRRLNTGNGAQSVCKGQPEPVIVEAKRWLLTASIGLFTGVSYYLINIFSRILVAAKLGILFDLIVAEKTQMLTTGLALMFFLLIDIICGYVAWFVVFIEPTAQGSGVSDVKCFLNGINLQAAISLRTYLFRMIGVVFSIASGLPIGNEGPMVQAGAALGAAISRGICDCGLQDLLDYYRVCLFGRTTNMDRNKDTGCCCSLHMPEFCLNKELRDFVACGAGAGLAAALGAPIGGLLFVLGDSHSFWSSRLSGRCLLGASISVLAVYVLKAAGAHIDQGQLHVLVRNNGGAVGFALWEMGFATIVGAFCGIIGSLFVLGNRHLQISRNHASTTGMIRLAEVIILVLVVSSLSFVVPLVAGSCIDLPVPTISSDPAPGLVRFYCPDTQYNDLASMCLTDSSSVIKLLFQSVQVGPSLSNFSLLLFFFMYIIMACLVCGASIAGGLFIPSVLSGAVLGRLMGNLLHSTKIPVDAGLCSVVGAAAMCVAILRISPLAATVIMLEMTGEISSTLPLIAASLSAHVVSSVVSDGIYTTLIALKGYPFLKEEWVETDSIMVLGRLRPRVARDIMTANIATLTMTVRVSELRAFLLKNSYRWFPVVDENYRPLGLVRRIDLTELVKHSSRSSASESEEADEE